MLITVEVSQTTQSPRGDQIHYLNNYQVQANIIPPEGEVQSVSLNQVAPGQYQVAFKPGQKGVYLIQVTANPPDQSSAPLSATAGWVLDYAPEYRMVSPESAALSQILLSVDGIMASGKPSDIFTHNIAAPRTYQPVWSWLLTVAACLLPIDIAIRRLIIGKQDLLHVWVKVKEHLGWHKRTVPMAQEYHPIAVQSLLNTKARVHQKQHESVLREVVQSHPPSQQPSIGVVFDSKSGPSDTLGSPPQPSTLDNQEYPGQATTSHLLAHKRRQRKP